jgi:hypothetical protein
MTGPSGSDEQADGGAFWLRTLAVTDPSKIDGLRLIETGDGPVLLYSIQTMKSPPSGFSDHQMLISAASVKDPSQVTPVVSLPRLLPPPPRWDARAAAGGGYEILYEEAGGALYKLLLRDPAGHQGSPSAAHPFESFTQPRFVRGRSNAPGDGVSAVLDSQTVVVFPPGASAPASAAAAPPPASHVPLGPASAAVVGVWGQPWVAAKTALPGPTSFNEPPGKLSLRRLGSLAAAAATVSTLPFPGFLAFQFDALELGDEVVIFATGKPAALLLASRPSRPILFATAERSQLSALSRPTISTAGGHLHVAAIANPGTPEARVLYGDIPIGALHRP